MVYRALLAFLVIWSMAPPAVAADAHTFRAQVTVEHAGKGHGDNSGVVLWLTPVAGEVRVTPPAQHFRLAQKNKRFEPHLLVVPVGSVVDFPNLDPFFHNVFSLYKGKKFDLGLYEAGSSRAVQFDRQGVSFIFCNIHPEMSAALVALASPYYAVSNAKGEVAIPNVPPGRYRLEVWYERSSPPALAQLAREINVSGEMQTVTLKVPELFNGNVPHKNKFGKDYDPQRPY